MVMHPKKIEHLRRRSAMGLNQNELANEFGISQPHVSRMLRSNYVGQGKNPEPEQYNDEK